MKQLRLLLPLLLLLALPLIASPTYAQEPGDFVLGETSVVVPANGEATLRFQTFCLDFGKEFPSTLGTPDGRADDDVLRAVKYGLEQNIASDDPLALQLAIWSLRESQSVEQLYPDTELEGAELAQQILSQSESVEVSPLAEDRGISLDQAVADGTIEASSTDFTFVQTNMPRPDDEPYHGEGTLILRNTTDQDVEVYFPFGTVFQPNNDAEQAIVAYATELEQLPTATPAPTNTPAPTSTPAPTVTPAATPGTVPQTGAPGDAAPGNSVPWLLVGVGMLLLTSAGILLVRFQES